jgi:hypothetical protein
VELNVLKVVGALVLILPMIPPRYKEWAYAGFAITMISAFIGHWVIDGLGFLTFMPLIFLAILIVSYTYYHKLRNSKEEVLKFNFNA